MPDLIWFGHITGDTPMREIGWVWLLLILAVAFVAVAAIKLWRGW